MRISKKGIFPGLWLLILFGCQSSAVPLKEAIPVPPERVLAFQKALSTDSATIQIVRDLGVGFRGCYLEIYVNLTLAARIDKGEKVTFYLSPGPLLLQVGPDLRGKLRCGYDPGTARQINTTVGPNEEKVFRISSRADEAIHLSREKAEP